MVEERNWELRIRGILERGFEEWKTEEEKQENMGGGIGEGGEENDRWEILGRRE
jgi:hypothetical protein